MTTEEKMEVMKAFTEGKVIQCQAVIGDAWCDDSNPCWDWNHFYYRIKEEPTYRPYTNIEEMYEDVKKRLVAIQHPVFSGIWLKQKDYEVEEMIAGIDPVKYQILLGKNWMSIRSVFRHYTYFDGTPFGFQE